MGSPFANKGPLNFNKEINYKHEYTDDTSDYAIPTFRNSNVSLEDNYGVVMGRKSNEKKSQIQNIVNKNNRKSAPVLQVHTDGPPLPLKVGVVSFFTLFRLSLLFCFSQR